MPHFIFIQQISVLNILNMLYNLHFFSSKCRLFHNATLFGFCITHILNTGCAKIWTKKKYVAKRLICQGERKESCTWNWYRNARPGGKHCFEITFGVKFGEFFAATQLRNVSSHIQYACVKAKCTKPSFYMLCSMGVKKIREYTELRASIGPKRTNVRGIPQNAAFSYCDTANM